MKKIKKQDIVCYLDDLQYSHGYDHWPIAFRIKMDKSSFTEGQSPQFGVKNDPGYDDRWEEWLNEHDSFFWQCCDDALSGIFGEHKRWEFLEGHPDKRLSEIVYTFHTAGRYGGWLVLDKYEGIRFFRVQEWEEWEYEDLWLLYKFCQEVQNVVDHRYEEFEYLYATKRRDLEREWQEEDKEAEIQKQKYSW